MRQVVLDTETTGLSPADGDRVISIGCVEIVDRVITGKEWHTHLNPEGRESHPEALKVHGLTSEMLARAPLFVEEKFGLWMFLKGADSLVIHNAPFDLGFLNAEIARLGSPVTIESLFTVIDTLKLTPSDGMRVGGSLNALADRYKVDRTAREKYHGALVDARVLAQVYLAMTRGNEELSIDDAKFPIEAAKVDNPAVRPDGLIIPVVRPSPGELEAHRTMMKLIRSTA